MIDYPANCFGMIAFSEKINNDLFFLSLHQYTPSNVFGKLHTKVVHLPMTLALV